MIFCKACYTGEYEHDCEINVHFVGDHECLKCELKTIMEGYVKQYDDLDFLIHPVPHRGYSIRGQVIRFPLPRSLSPMVGGKPCPSGN